MKLLFSDVDNIEKLMSKRSVVIEQVEEGNYCRVVEVGGGESE